MNPTHLKLTRAKKGTFLLLLLFLATACAVGPNYHAPQSNAPAQWISAEYKNTEVDIEQNWWKQFHDETLDALITKAFSGNYDLKISSARIAEARAMREIARGGLLPTVDLKSSATREGNQIAIPANPLLNTTKPFNIFQGGFDASWELDLFGGKRREWEAAIADLQASEASRDASRVSVLAEVARTYMDIRRYQAELNVAEDIIKSAQKTVSLTQERFRSGNSAGIDVLQAQALLTQQRALLPQYRSQLEQAQYAMDVLLGEKPGYTYIAVASIKPIPSSLSSALFSAPARVIANRPDIRMAERKLASAIAMEGVATAAFFPDISLSGFLGLLTTDAGKLFMSGSRSWLAAGSVTWPIFNYAKLTANLELSRARHQEALLSYEQSIIAALSDVERAATALHHDEQRRDLLVQNEAENRHVTQVMRERYKAGIISFLEVLDSERNFYASQTQAIEAQATVSEDFVVVYKSLGGGWRDSPSTPVTKIRQKSSQQSDKR